MLGDNRLRRQYYSVYSFNYSSVAQLFKHRLDTYRRYWKLDESLEVPSSGLISDSVINLFFIENSSTDSRFPTGISTWTRRMI